VPHQMSKKLIGSLEVAVEPLCKENSMASLLRYVWHFAGDSASHAGGNDGTASELPLEFPMQMRPTIFFRWGERASVVVIENCKRLSLHTRPLTERAEAPHVW
jgi:hypothetical protein